MYENIYNLSDNPFKLTPNPEFFYPSRIHQKVMAYLQYGVEQGDGFIVVTGSVGTGKTTIIETLVNELKNNSDLIISKITSTQLNEGELIKMVASSFGIDITKQSKAALLFELEKFLRQKSAEKKRVLLIVDEAQNMPRRSLEELRMLSNYQENGRPLFQSFLVGQQQFKKMINRADMEQLSQRVIASYHLDPLDLDDMKKYIEHRLSHVGWNHDPEIQDEAYAKIYSYTGGVPRLINVFCGRLLLHSAMDELHAIDSAVVETVINELDDESAKLSLRAGAKKAMSRKPASAEEDKLVRLEKRVKRMEAKLRRLEDTIEMLVSEFEL